MRPSSIVALGDACVALRFDAGVDLAVNGACIAIAASLERQQLRGVRDVVPSFDAVTVHFDPLVTDRAALSAQLEALRADVPSWADTLTRVIEVPVVYGGEAGPDLGDVAAYAGCSAAAVVRLHTQQSYRVFMLGFLPGFAYMGPVEARIAAPRLPTPRLRVPAGAVGIAGMQTGIYPFESPGGWRIIGRTEMKPFDPARADPFLFKAGDRVKFVEA